MSTFHREILDKRCLIYCGPDKCNCSAGTSGRVHQEILGLVLSPNPELYVIYRMNLALLRGGLTPEVRPNYLDNLEPGTSRRIEARRSSGGIVTYWPAGSLAAYSPRAEEEFGRVLQLLTVRSRWKPMVDAPHNGENILIWDGDEAHICFRGDGQRYPEAWVPIGYSWTMIGEALAWREVPVGYS